MKTLMLDTADNNFALAAFNWQLTSTVQQWLAQKLRIRLSMFLGEWFLDGTIGLDYFGTILVKGANMQAVSAALKSAILGCPGVASLVSFSLSVAATPTPSRAVLQGSFSVEAETGEIVQVNYE